MVRRVLAQPKVCLSEIIQDVTRAVYVCVCVCDYCMYANCELCPQMVLPGRAGSQATTTPAATVALISEKLFSTLPQHKTTVQMKVPPLFTLNVHVHVHESLSTLRHPTGQCPKFPVTVTLIVHVHVKFPTLFILNVHVHVHV